ncbi:MAG: peptide chain release factor N(5)-glutamine methyltransferase [Candidatus Dormiibacterota bacterium]
MKLLQVLQRATSFLERAHVARPRLEAELLLAHGLGIRRIDLYLQFERPLAEGELTLLRDLLSRRAAGCPTAYLVGNREFYGITIGVATGVLIPRPETEQLVEIGLARLSALGRPSRAADLGTGSGCLALALASGRPDLTVDAVDISEIAVKQARENVERLGVGDRVTVAQGSWAEPLRRRPQYDLIVSNPPYVTSEELQELDRTVRDFEPKLGLDGGSDGLAAYRDLSLSLGSCVGPGTTVLLEGDPRRLPAVREIFLSAWPDSIPALHQDLSHRDRVLEIILK